jgi:hypothetical protein
VHCRCCDPTSRSMASSPSTTNGASTAISRSF